MKHLIYSLLIIHLAHTAHSQGIGIGTSTPDSSAKLDVSSTNSGFLPPRMTFQQRNAIVNPARGLMIYCLDCGSWNGMPQYFDGKSWRNLTGEEATGSVAYLPSVTIGNREWTVSNLNVTTYRNGEPIPEITNPTSWSNSPQGAWCWYNNDSANGAIYGRLYNWKAVTDPRGLAPLGWRIPTQEDMEALYNALPAAESGGALKDTGTTRWLPPNAGATNSTGFTALPGGFMDGTFSGIGSFGSWWYDDRSTGGDGSDIILYNSTELFNTGSRVSSEGRSVRLVKDE